MAGDLYQTLQEALGCRFKNLDGLRQALTHASTGAGANYERLEFLGDRVLSLVIAEILYDTFPQEAEGDLARRHAALVAGETLAVLARMVDLGRAMDLSAAERASGGAGNDNILADGLEAVIGALYRDSGLAACQDVIKRLWGDRLHVLTQPPRDAKTALQEWAQGRGLPLPLYDVVKRTGPDHAPVFEISVTVQGFTPAVGRGSSRRAAEKEAAQLLLAQLEESP